MAKTIDQLQTEIEKKEAQLSQERHKEQRLKNRLKYYEKGERIAHLVIIATPTITLHNTYELPESSRGAQGFGSSGLS